MSAIDWHVHTYAQLSSSQDYGRELAEEGLPEGTVIQCLMQKRGRGRQGREWVSPMGNLYMSFILRPDCTPDKAGQISFVVAVALSKAIDQYIDDAHKKTLKWPNDILIDGKKCAGILIESTMGDSGNVSALTVGVGVNIIAPPEEAIGLQQVSGKTQVSIHPFRDVFLAEMAVLYTQWKNQGFGPIRTQWLKNAHGLNQPVKATIGDTIHEGIFKDLDKDGALVLTLADGTNKEIRAGDVFFEPVN